MISLSTLVYFLFYFCDFFISFLTCLIDFFFNFEGIKFEKKFGQNQHVKWGESFIGIPMLYTICFYGVTNGFLILNHYSGTNLRKIEVDIRGGAR